MKPWPFCRPCEYDYVPNSRWLLLMTKKNRQAKNYTTIVICKFVVTKVHLLIAVKLVSFQLFAWEFFFFVFFVIVFHFKWSIKNLYLLFSRALFFFTHLFVCACDFCQSFPFITASIKLQNACILLKSKVSIFRQLQFEYFSTFFFKKNNDIFNCLYVSSYAWVVIKSLVDLLSYDCLSFQVYFYFWYTKNYPFYYSKTCVLFFQRIFSLLYTVVHLEL